MISVAFQKRPKGSRSTARWGGRMGRLESSGIERVEGLHGVGVCQTWTEFDRPSAGAIGSRPIPFKEVDDTHQRPRLRQLRVEGQRPREGRFGFREQFRIGAHSHRPAREIDVRESHVRERVVRIELEGPLHASRDFAKPSGFHLCQWCRPFR